MIMVYIVICPPGRGEANTPVPSVLRKFTTELGPIFSYQCGNILQLLHRNNKRKKDISRIGMSRISEGSLL